MTTENTGMENRDAENRDAENNVTKTTQISTQPELPAPRGRTIFLVLAVLCLSILLTKQMAGKQENLLTAQLAVATVPVVADRHYVIEKVIAPAGKTVEKGDVLLLVRDQQITAELIAQQRDVELRQREFNECLAKSEIDLTWRLRTLTAEILDTQLQITEILKTEYDHSVSIEAIKGEVIRPGELLTSPTSQPVFKQPVRQENLLVEDGMNTLLLQEKVRNAVEVTQVQRALYEKRLKTLQQLKKTLPEYVRQAFGVTAAKKRLATAENKLADLQAKNQPQKIVSPGFGTVGKWRCSPKGEVRAGQFLGMLEDSAERYFIAHVPAEKLNDFQPGEVVQLRFPNGDEREGKIGRRIEVNNDSETDSSSSNKELTAIRIEPSGKLWPKIPIGATVEIVLPE